MLFANLYPNFNKGRILKKEMLENLRDYPRSFIDICFKKYSDGIIAGADIAVGEDELTIGTGMIKHNGTMYMLEDEYRLPYHATGAEAIIKVRFTEKAEHSDFVSYGTEILLSQDMQVKRDECELGRFKLKEGARLRSEYQDFADLATEYNTVNIIHAQYAGVEKSTLHPYILRYFATDILKHNCSNPYDIVFAMQCMNQPAVDRELILYYIVNRLEIPYTQYSNEQMHKYLGRIVEEVKRGHRVKPGARHGGPQRVIVD
ncbi:DNA and RNA helicase [Aneurinibacillus aneurinilyticus]